MDKETLKMFSELLDSKLGEMENRIDAKLDNNTMILENLISKVDKNALELETINSKLEIIAEVQQNIMVQTQKQIQEIMEPLCEDVSLIKSAIQHISNEV